MSLNGLEAVEVNEAYQSALGEGGGWFLLHYMSRDEVALFGRGGGGLVEVQEAINRYKEQSPLFGFIQYRRRKVILKYVPEGTSRLLQARVSVHFQSISEKLTPHDTIFEFANLSELQESALSSACSLHTATASIKSSNESLLQRGLAGITEDVSESRIDDVQEEENRQDSQNTLIPRRISGDSQTRPEKVNEGVSAKQFHQKSPSIATQHSSQRGLQRARTISNVYKALPPTPGELERHNVSSNSILDQGENQGRSSVDGRMSSQSARPSKRDLYDANGYKQKVKVGPRPSLDSGGRSDNIERSNEFRPVSTLPAGVRLPSRKVIPHKTVSSRPQSQQSDHTYYENMSSRQLPLAAPVTPIQIPEWKRSIVSNGLLTPAKTPAEAKIPKETPEKSRLMKALQLRQKQLTVHNPTKELMVEEAPAEQSYLKHDIDDSILKAIIDASDLKANLDMVHVDMKDLSREVRNAEDSPISIPEISEGPSTQASSISDEEESAEQVNRESNMEAVSAAPADDPTISGMCEGKTLHESSDAKASSLEREFHQVGRLGEADETKHRADVERTHSPTQVPLGLKPSFHGKSEQLEELQQVPLADGAMSRSPILAGKEVRTQDSDHTNTAEAPSSAKSALLNANPHSTEMESVLPTVTFINDSTAIVSGQRDNRGITAKQHADPSATGSNQIRNLRRSREQSSPAQGALSVFTGDVSPFEVPLPPIDEDEEALLDPNQTSFQSSLTAQSPAAEVQSQQKTPINERESQDTELTPIRHTVSETVEEQQAQRQIRRRGLVNPPKRVSSPEHSDEMFLSDDSFMEELKSATVQQAKPISVSKSPIKPVFSRADSDQRLIDTSKTTRSVSSPLTQNGKDEEIFASPRNPIPQSSRSISATQFLRADTQQASGSMPKKVGVSSGISQRIKALEQLSSRPTSPQSAGPSSTPTFISLRKPSIRTPQDVVDPRSNTNISSRPATAYPSPSPSPSPEAVKSKSLINLDKAGFSRPDSVSVTATIIRDASDKTLETPINLSEPRTMDLHQSPLVIKHDKMGPPPLSPLKPPRPRYARYSSARSGSSSSTEQKIEAPQPTRRDSFVSMLSRSSRAGSDVELKSTFSDSSFSGAASPDEMREEKKDSKRSRLMKRMSSISSMSRKSIANVLSPSPKEAPIVERQETIAETPAGLVDMGDVNIQFPDTLLWKRRHMIIDERGILVLSASRADNNSKVVTKKFPLAGFRSPYIPDQDRQELPNSVMLDFKDGSTLQCACEHPQAQTDVLRTLREAHSLHQSQ